MCMYWGWPPIPFDFGDLHSWSFEGNISGELKTIGLGLFTFLSGFCLYFSKAKQLPFGKFLIHKVKRLLVPCAFFALLYWLIFPTMMYDNDAVNGTHLWYIPMIFICIMIVSAQIYIQRGWMLVILLYAIIRKATMYIEFRTFYEFLTYFPIFYGGFLLNMFLSDGSHVIEQIKSMGAKATDYICLIGLLVLFPYFTKITHKLFLFDADSISLTMMLCVIYVMVDRLRMANIGGGKCLFLNKLIHSIDSNSFAIYLLHQFYINFVLVILRDKLALVPTFIGSCSVFVIILILSYLTAITYTYCSNKLKNIIIHK